MKKRKPILKKIRMEFTQDDFFMVVANSSKEGFKALKAHNKRLKHKFPKEMKHCPAFCWQQPAGFGIAVFFRFDDLKARYVCHEVSHATHAALDSIGLRLSDETDEVYAYHNDMLFRACVEFMKENNLKIKI